jgi:hypothetical protein
VNLSPTLNPPGLRLRLEQACLGLLALVLILVPLFFYTLTQDQFELPKVILMRILSSLMLGVAAAWMALSPKAPWRRTALDWPLLGFSLWLGIKTLSSVSPALSWRGEYENFAGSLTQLNYSLLFWMATQFAGSWPRARFLALALLTGALGAAAYSVLQACQRDFIVWASQSYVSDRFFGPLGNPNFLAGLTCMAIPLKLCMAWDDDQAPAAGLDRAWWARLGLIAVGILTYAHADKLGQLNLFGVHTGEDAGAKIILWLWLGGILASGILQVVHRKRAARALGHGLDLLLLFKALTSTATRGGFLGLMVGVLVIALGWMRWRSQGGSFKRLFPRLLLALGGAILALCLAFYGLGASFSQRIARTLANPAEALESGRLQIWIPALKIWKDHPVTGTGVDTFKTVFPSYSTSRFNHFDGENVSSRMAHCEPLQILATMGAVGLLLWLIFCGSLFRAWWQRLGSQPESALFTIGLGALAAAYLAQNLVSFGVSSISAPFFIAAALIFSGDPVQAERENLRTPWSPGLSLGLGLLIAGVGAWEASRTFVADLDYASGFQIHQQLQSADHIGFDDAQGMASYAIQQLQPQLMPGQAAPAEALSADNADEMNLWLPTLMQLSRQAQEKPALKPQLQPVMQQGALALLYTVAARDMEHATALCPQEVKYQVYRGLAYEELYKHTQPQRRKLWFDKAQQAYELSIRMNPMNAYYQGNLGRLLGTAAEAGAADFYPPAAEHYRDAIRIAPVTRLFYENLVLLNARYAKLKDTADLMDSLEARDKDLAPGVLIAAASTFFQWRKSGDGPWTAQAKQAALPLCASWAKRAVALAPAHFSDPRDQDAFADYAFTWAVFAEAAGERQDARVALARSLQWKPKNPDLAAFKKQKGL